MKITLDASKSIHENAASYFEKAKRAREKREGLKKAIADVEQKIAALEKQLEQKSASAVLVERSVRHKEWFERFHWFRTSGSRLCIAGKDASQNETIVKHYLEEKDLFFHADVQGAAATALKDGLAASAEEKLQAAQWAACYSKAWKGGFATVDVYAVPKMQVSKSPKPGEYIAKGSFIITGKREWFKNTELKLAVGLAEGGELRTVPKPLSYLLPKSIEITPGEKKELADKAAKALGLDKHGREELLQLIP